MSSMYIRTKDGVYEELDTTEQGVWTIYGNFIENNEILNQSKNLEKLCDEFVLVDETLPPYIDRDFKEINMYKTYIAGSRGNVYGAIWTSKGLIYVTKMNEKGELELI